MQFLFDTAALSELTKPRPNAGFMEWMKSQSSADAYISSFSLGELEFGISLLDPSKKRRSLEAWVQSMLDQFRDRILPFDTECARAWVRALAHSRRRRHTVPVVDSQIAAVAHVHGLAIVTPNERHFGIEAFEKLAIVNPWSKT